MTNEIITALVSRGFKRWTKGNIDRLYIKSEYIGLDITYHKSGTIASATLNGEHVSNTRAYGIKAAKNYIDIATGECASEYPELVTAMQEILAEVTAMQENAELPELPETVHADEVQNMSGTKDQIAQASQIICEAKRHLSNRIQYYAARIESDGAHWMRYLAAYKKVESDLHFTLLQITDSTMIIKRQNSFTGEALDQIALSLAANSKFAANTIE